MRLCTLLSPCLTAAALLVPVSSANAAAGDPSCAGSDGRSFPLTTRIHGGPTAYEAGGGYGTWYLDLTNTTGRTCAGVHPVVVLVDGKRSLKPAQAKLEFYDGSRVRPVTFETTDEAELVGAFDGNGFGGFSVAPGKTLTVKVRLAVTSDAVPDQVTANAAVVQRHQEDGDWVGESNAYPFAIGTEPVPDSTGSGDSDSGSDSGTGSDTTDAPSDAPSGTATGNPTDAPRGTPTDGNSSDPSASSDPDAAPTGPSVEEADGDGDSGGGWGDGGRDGDDRGEDGGGREHGDGPHRAWELARTGLGLGHGALALTCGLLALGGAALAVRRRR
ncbi:hypothetical protein [Streptomyces olivochromogenes]|uniref:hypothetical protein n=1 Tax=Streptomyces olivochromogenes TaxID=1963 RepID=UPI0027E53597|nr:hypothetical protein [Streptomyces olivochromogenes]